ncbi:MAG: helix-turn-helix domain-containing protein [Candidatus Odinarchaeota archaeon]
MVSISKKDDSATKHALELIGLAHDEVDTYYKMTGRGPVMVGEIALLTNVTEERAAEIANNLFEKGLLKQIPGKTPIYEALPPYAALVGQIHQFKEAIKSFQQYAPQNIQSKFDSLEDQSAKLKKLDDYKSYLQIMKSKLPAEIKVQFNRFEKELEQVKRFQDVRRFIFNLKEIVPADITRDFESMASRLDSVKSEISAKFEKQFRDGALSSMAEKIVSKVISEQFEEITKTFKDRFVQTTQNMLDQVINQLGSITDTAGEISTDLGTIFTDIQGGMVSTLEDLEKKVSGVYDDVLSGIAELKQLFRTEIFESLQDDIIFNIINQLESAEMTMQEFWERSKQASLLSFKDVWFVRSIEGIKAQINAALSRVKMRVHIVAPKLEDIDLFALTNLQKHVNIRISTNFDLNNPEDQMRFKQVEDYTNLTIRHYPRENLWSINKDFEEVVVCVVSKKDTGEFEIAGMGSVLEEHVKLFAAVLEDVWIQSKKFDQVEISQAIKYAPEPSIPPPQYQKPITPSMPKVTQPLPPKPITTPKPVTPTPTPIKPQLEPVSPAPTVPPGIDVSTDAFLSNQFDNILGKIDTLPGEHIALLLERLQDDLLEKKGFSAILRQIRMGINPLKSNINLLNNAEKEDLRNKISFWRSKLKL